MSREKLVSPRSTDASETLQALRRLHGLGIRRLGTVWFPLYAYGAIFLGAAPVALIVHRNHLLPYMLTGLCIASVLTARHYRRRADSEGVYVSVVPWLAISIVMMVAGGVAAIAGSELGSDFLSTAAPFLVVASFFLIFSAVARSRFLFTISVLMVLCSIVAVPLASGDGRVALQFGLFGAVLVASASIQLRKDRRRA